MGSEDQLNVIVMRKTPGKLSEIDHSQIKKLGTNCLEILF